VADVLVLAVAAAFYPTLLAGVILILTRPNPKRQLAGFLLGGMVASVTCGLVILSALEGAGVAVPSHRDVGAAAYLAAGALSLVVSAAVWRRRAAPPRRRKPPREKPSRVGRLLGRGSLPVAILVGAALNLPGMWYLLALDHIGEADYGTLEEVALVIMFNLVMFALVEVPLAWYIVSPDGAQAAVSRFDGWLHANSRPLAAALGGCIGVYLLVRGLIQALGGS
jgi:Sap, sulfolipid-1-addressing protein